MFSAVVRGQGAVAPSAPSAASGAALIPKSFRLRSRWRRVVSP